MNKRKLMLVALSLCLVAILAMGGTLAYFTDTDEATNVFTMGHVSIEQYEQERVGSELQPFTNKEIYPAVYDKLDKEPVTVDGYDFNIRSQEGNYIDKIVNVKNTGTQDAFIRTIIAIPNMNGYDDASPAQNPLHWNYLDATDFDGIGWNWSGSKTGAPGEQSHKIADVEIEGLSYDLYVATYNTAVAANEFTSPSMVGFYLDKSFGHDDEGYFSIQNDQRIDLDDWIPVENGVPTLKILVATQAVQTKGFDDPWEALDEAFGEISADNHPWAE